MKYQLIESLNYRIHSEIAPQNPLNYLKDTYSEVYIDSVIAVLYLYTRPKKNNLYKHIYLTELISALGHAVRTKLKLKKNSALAAKTGAFILYSFQEEGILKIALAPGKSGHATYIVQILDDDAIIALWESLPTSEIEKLPSEIPYAPWTSSRHETGLTLVKTGSKKVLKELTLNSHPILFNCINKAQSVGWRINPFIYELQLWALRNKTEAFSDIWEQQNPEAKATKLREARAIADIAKRFLGKTFWHLYYYDFRGRRYPTSAYLHEQGSDVAKGLLLRQDKKAITKDGFFWLMVSLASNWAGDAGGLEDIKTDKLPLQARYGWSLDNEEILISYAEKPKVNQGWMKADKPWQFLAACHELKCLRDWQNAMRALPENDHIDIDEYGYYSHLECFIDGSTNGAQHLTALTKDEITAPYVNLIPSEKPGDLYEYVAEHIWQHFEDVTWTYSKGVKETCNRYIDNLIEIKKQINAAELKSDHRLQLIEKIKALKLKNKDIENIASPLFWLRIKDSKHRRKIVKRNVMTIPYGGTAFGLGEQIINDAKKHGIDQLLFMEHKWAAFMGRTVFEDCKKSLARPMRLLNIFEQAGKNAEARNQFLSWTVPLTNFPVIQHYTEGKVKKIWVQYGPPKGLKRSTGYYINTLQLAICFLEDTTPSKRKQAQGCAPNVIHSLDAAHLTLIVDRADFPVTTVHDSFGCLLADMPKLFRITRETFVELYQQDPLTSIMKDIGGDISGLKLGTLDISLILDSEFCFA